MKRITVAVLLASVAACGDDSTGPGYDPGVCVPPDPVVVVDTVTVTDTVLVTDTTFVLVPGDTVLVNVPVVSLRYCWIAQDGHDLPPYVVCTARLPSGWAGLEVVQR